MCRTFAAEPIEASLALTMISLSFLTFQLRAHPYRVAWVNQLQVCASFCLVMLCALESCFSAFRSVSVNIEGTPLEDFGHRVSICMILLLFPTPIFLVYGMIFCKVGARCSPGRVSDSRHFRFFRTTTPMRTKRNSQIHHAHQEAKTTSTRKERMQ
jgi:hypothetical protein